MVIDEFYMRRGRLEELTINHFKCCDDCIRRLHQETAFDSTAAVFITICFFSSDKRVLIFFYARDVRQLTQRCIDSAARVKTLVSSNDTSASTISIVPSLNFVDKLTARLKLCPCISVRQTMVVPVYIETLIVEIVIDVFVLSVRISI